MDFDEIKKAIGDLFLALAEANLTIGALRRENDQLRADNELLHAAQQAAQGGEVAAPTPVDSAA